MSIEEIRGQRNAEPFEPFDLVMRDGRVVHVEDPIRIALAPSGTSVSVYDGPAVATLPVAGIVGLKPRPLSEQARRFRSK